MPVEGHDGVAYRVAPILPGVFRDGDFPRHHGETAETLIDTDGSAWCEKLLAEAGEGGKAQPLSFCEEYCPPHVEREDLRVRQGPEDFGKEAVHFDCHADCKGEFLEDLQLRIALLKFAAVPDDLLPGSLFLQCPPDVQEQLIDVVRLLQI